MRLRAVPPVASSSRAARLANPSARIEASISWAVRNCSGALTRRRSRRNHSPGRARAGAHEGPSEPIDRLAVSAGRPSSDRAPAAQHYDRQMWEPDVPRREAQHVRVRTYRQVLEDE